ncbi:bifunctional transcriptional activator/DNA repair enzyme AdaA [Chitinophaga solisilvae]|uniref:Methylated-DNA--protein-cysteine methyltransferase n=1 Tax=Chitinophaga solisilvae TaxID=1233460 RepID=A0A3S1AU70_9BACT|nr:methylated-DNA--[protein]-cysteine S-methyltransferase [Chitinophaga solisilvae]NSL86312.1 bifunctional transcriptional activator/DNA repair protein Ada [Chitinophaga solisilvae]
MLTNEIMYKALVEKDSSYEGSFIAAVKTTGIFCRPTCTARKPKPENVEFLKTAREAILKGYRPCRVCNPLEKFAETPVFIRDIIQELNADPALKMKDEDLIRRGIEPNKIRRWFLKNHGITFQAYQRMLRINYAFKRIQNGESVTAVAFDSGYESLSGFADSFKTIVGAAPAHSKMTRVLNLTRLETPLGTMIACAAEEGICLLEFTDRKMLETELAALKKLLKASVIQGAHPHFNTLQQQLDEYFEGRRKTFSVPLFMPGTPFQQQVWEVLQTIPYGASRSYKQQAIALNRPEAVRAIANANGMNRISILVPCHRVIGEDGSMTGYGGGIWRKQWLLDLEKNGIPPR